jgi:ferredoxin/flavodoxin---NADP+ reductase
MTDLEKLQVAIIGAGPAGLFASKELATNGVSVALFNRDIKPGGLAEYGIFLDKHKIKDALRAQFEQTMDLPNVHYFGNVTIGLSGCIGIKDLKDWGFPVVLVTCGAQGTKTLGLPGEDLPGVYHAKDLVYHYNSLPPYSQQEFKIGKKVAIVGAGNVMTDIAHYLINYCHVEKVTVIVRRGPAEVKFHKKEMEPIISYLDLEDFEKELTRVSPEMETIGQDPKAARANILSVLESADPKTENTKMYLRFLYSPVEIISNAKKEVLGIKLEKNDLKLIDGVVHSNGTGEFKDLDVDTVIFAIGDRVTNDMGLPMSGSSIFAATTPDFPIEGVTYEIGDLSTGKPIPGLFFAGWARNASTGLVGIARRDGVNAAHSILQYLKQKEITSGIDEAALISKLDPGGCNFVPKSKLAILEAAEIKQAQSRSVEEFKFSTNEEMLKIMGLA